MLPNNPNILARDAVVTQLRQWQADGKTVGFTSGAFDLLHAGHVSYLQAAASRCDFLVVALNSDRSIKSYKNPDRPINIEDNRATVLAALSSVSLVFIFDEDNNNRNIELLKPDIYFKAGDYTEAQLSSAPLVRSYGGDVQIIPFVSGCSSTAIIDKILLSYAQKLMIAQDGAEKEKRPAIFLDRDGTLIEHVQYLHDPEQVRFFPDGLAPLLRLQEAGFRLVMITNQPGIGLGYFSKEDFYRVNLAVFREATKVGVLFDKVYFSPFGKADQTKCRKPNTGMVDRAVADLNIDLTKSYVIGDTTTDMQLAENISCPGILVETGYAGDDRVYAAKPTKKVAGLKEAVNYILSQAHD